MQITTTEELDALPGGAVIQPVNPEYWANWVTSTAAQKLLSGGFWMFIGNDELYSPEQMVENEQTYIVLYNPDQPISAAPTCQPSVESIKELIWAQFRCICGGCWLDSQRPEAEVKAEAEWQMLDDLIDRYFHGEKNRFTLSDSTVSWLRAHPKYNRGER